MTVNRFRSEPEARVVEASDLFVPKDCPATLGGTKCVLEFGHKGLHQSFNGPNPHRSIR